jgi:hypothetical protein
MNLKALAACAAVASVMVASVMVAGIGGGVASAATTGATSSGGKATPSCTGSGPDDGWPAVVQGRPDSFDAGDRGGVYLWHDASGWHLRVTHATDDKAAFTGIIRSKSTVSNVQPVQLEQNDKVKVKVDKAEHVIAFRFLNYGHIDGVDWTAPCARALRFSFKRGGQKLTSTVFLGDKKVHPKHDPFAVKRAA